MTHDEPTPAGHPDRTVTLARAALAVIVLLPAAFVVAGYLAGADWPGRLLGNGWLATLAIVVIAAVAALPFDMTRPKNVAWRGLRGRFGDGFGEALDRKTFGTGRGQIGDHAYFGLRCYGSPGGLEIGRIMTFVNPPLYIPWSAMAKIDTFPNLLTGRKDFETDMQARIVLRDDAELSIEVPWLTEYRQLLPKTVKYRSIKLSKK